MKRSFLGLTIAVIFIGCGFKRSPIRVRVEVPEKFSGKIRLEPCVSGPVDARLNASGSGQTAACPSSRDNVELIVVRNGQEIYVAPKDIRIARTGDQIATVIETDVR
jgi:hypothetical protein